MIFTIDTSEDGDVYFHWYDTEEEFLTEFNSNQEESEHEPVFKKLPKTDNVFGNYLNLTDADGMIVIRGELANPQPISVVKEYGYR